jgi:hypothetical protein
MLHVLSTGERRPVTRGYSARYLPTGHVLYSVGVLFGVPFDLQRRQIVGEAVTLVEGIHRSGFGGSGQNFVVSPTGVALYVPGPASHTLDGWHLGWTRGGVSRGRSPDPASGRSRVRRDASRKTGTVAVCQRHRATCQACDVEGSPEQWS